MKILQKGSVLIAIDKGDDRMTNCEMWLSCRFIDSDVMCKTCTNNGGEYDNYEPEDKDESSFNLIDENLCSIKMNCS